MITSLKLVNFRNFKEKIIDNFEMENFIVGENGKGKTNILEALSLVGNNSLLKLSLDNLIKIGESYFFIEIKIDNGDIFSLSYSVSDKKKNYIINNKKTSSKNFFSNSYSCVIFSPISMNMVYFSPNLRRDFLDDTLKSSYLEYDKLLKDYKKILKSRNSTLKAINEGKAKKEEIKFWDDKFIELSKKIYVYRFELVDFLKDLIINVGDLLSGKIKNISFEYITKVDRENVENSLKVYLEKNFDRDVILQKTHIGPHIDDFIIKINEINVIQYASRGEVKSIMIYLKLLEGLFIEKKTGKKPIMIIDDLISELDLMRKSVLIEKIKYYQSFISCIFEEQNYFNIIL